MPARPLRKKLKSAARILGLKRYYQEQRSEAFDQRWAMVEARLDPGDRSLLDIGCNIGQFTARAAARGMFSIGLDVQHEALLRARRVHRRTRNIAFAWCELSPANVAFLPRTDATLCLSVHHYWSREHGEEAAWEMIREIASRSGKLFFEPASAHVRYGRVTPEFKDNDESSIADYAFRNLRRVTGGTRSVTLLGKTASIRTEQFRLLFLVE